MTSKNPRYERWGTTAGEAGPVATERPAGRPPRRARASADRPIASMPDHALTAVRDEILDRPIGVGIPRRGFDRSRPESVRS